ncbi:calbindin-32 isoform X1 [Hydra vulgaris]|uniref:calbindin-32 isoform X1 n=1 Tax=Hydra vulgaris TaxID=6087 RepID=UPI001F5ED8F4|nr:calbindin-32-like isoform X1 [Hydra vulgaris]
MSGSTNENYLTQYRNSYPLHVVDLFRIWYHYDVDKTGYLETPKFKKFLEDLITSGGNKTTTKEVEEYAKHMIETYDLNRDEKINICELSKLISIQKNFLKGFKKLSLKDFDVIFEHYNRSGTGRLDNYELLGFIFNLMEKIDAIKNPSIKDIEAYKAVVLRSIGKKGKNSVSKEDLQIFFI